MAKIKFGVITFPGTNCDRDSYHAAAEVAGADARMIWHTESDLSDIDVVFIPGGFSYGDYLRAGAVARFSPVLKAVIDHAEKGKAVLGVCNGFQVLAECGLVPGAFLRNKIPHFLCRHQTLRVENDTDLFTSKYQKGDLIRIPIAHAEGNFYLPEEDFQKAEANGQIAFRYSDEQGNVNDESNPNGSTSSIAGIYNEKKNVLGMMPHPERASEAELGSADGLLLFESVIEGLMK